MAVLTRHVRLLYLLALFQLLGGPLVLGGLMMVTRLMADREMTLSQSVSCTLRHLDPCHAIVNGEHCLAEADGLLPPSKPALPPLEKTKDGKGKLWAVSDLGRFIWHPALSLNIPGAGEHDPDPRKLAQAPPIPPPRWI